MELSACERNPRLQLLPPPSTALINVTNQPASIVSLPLCFGSVSMLFFSLSLPQFEKQNRKAVVFPPSSPRSSRANPPSGAGLRFHLLCSRPGTSALIPPAVLGVTPNVYLKDSFRCVSPVNVVQRQLLHPLDFAWKGRGGGGFK